MVLLKRREAGKGEPEPGTWWLAGDEYVGVACPTCKAWATLDHDVAADGTVTPSLICPYQPCTFHDMVKLEDWPSDQTRKSKTP